MYRSDGMSLTHSLQDDVLHLLRDGHGRAREECFRLHEGARNETVYHKNVGQNKRTQKVFYRCWRQSHLGLGASSDIKN